MSGRSGRNRPVPVYWEEGASRILNLLVTLLDSRTPRSTGWIREKVGGYEGTADTVRKQLERDRLILRQLGVQVTVESATDDEGLTEKRYSVDRETSFLPEFRFTPGQWAAVSAAGRWAMEPELAALVRAAVTKLTPAGPVSVGGPAPVVGALPDTTDLTDDDIRTLTRSLDQGHLLRFNYWPSPTAEPRERTLEPWGVAAVDGRLFLTGHDVDRGAQRTFRLSRIADLEPVPATRSVPVPDRPVRELVIEGLEAASSLVTATVLFCNGRAQELRARAVGDPVLHREGEVLTVGPVDRLWLVRTAAAYAPDAVVLGPDDIVGEIVTLLRHARDILSRSAGTVQVTPGTPTTQEDNRDHHR